MQNIPPHQRESLVKVFVEGFSSQPDQYNLKVVRQPHLAEKVVLVDGLPGNGKTIMSPILGAMPRVD